ncbi:TolC family protein [Undibacterium sp. 5I2]|nr:TolC family protein [Undibacterium sp. 5I2]
MLKKNLPPQALPPLLCCAGLLLFLLQPAHGRITMMHELLPSANSTFAGLHGSARQKLASADGADALPSEPAVRLRSGAGDEFAVVLERWVGDDAAGDPAGRSGLPHLVPIVQTAMLHNPSIRQYQAEWYAAQSDVAAVKGQRWPKLEINAASPEARFGGSPEAEMPDAVAQLSMSAVIPVFDWGRIDQTEKSRNHAENAARQRYRSALEESAYEVAGSVLELRRAQILTDISVAYVERMRALVAMMEEIVKADRGRLSELIQSKAKLLQAEIGRDNYATKVREAELNLRKLSGADYAKMLGPADSEPQAPQLSEVLARTNSNPLVLQAGHEAAAADASADALRAAAKPQLNWVFNKAFGDDVYGRSQPWNTKLTLSWVGFDGGASSASVAAAKLRAGASRERREQILLDQEFMVRAAHQDNQTQTERQRSYAALTRETTAVRKAFFEQWYYLGKRSLLDVLSAESDNYANQVNQVNSRYDSYGAVFRIYKAGGQFVDWLEQGANGKASSG